MTDVNRMNGAMTETDENLKSGCGLFPLKLTAFEKYMLYDNPKSCPVTFTARLIWKGKTDRERWNRSLAEALELHPLYRATVQKKRGNFYWILGTARPRIEWIDTRSEFESIPVSRFDLLNEYGIRILAFAEEDRLEFRMFVHHSCSDGAGFIDLFNDWFLFYERECREIARPHRNFRLLLSRNRFVFPPPPEKVPFLKRTFKKVFQVFRWLLQNPVPLKYRGVREECSKQPVAESKLAIDPKKMNGLNSCDFPQDIHYGKMDRVRTKEFIERAKSRGLTLNSVLLSRYFQKLSDPASELLPSRPSSLLSVTMPFNLRRSEMESMPSANVVSYCFIRRKMRECTDTLEFSKELADEIKRLKAWSVAAIFAVGLNIFGALPGLLAGMIRLPKTLSTAVYSNLGDTDRLFSPQLATKDGKIALDGLVLDDVWYTGPCRNRTNLFFAIYSYAGELHYAFRNDKKSVVLNSNFMKIVEDFEPVSFDAFTCSEKQSHLD